MAVAGVLFSYGIKMEKWEYIDNEKVLAKYPAKLKTPQKETEETICIITEKHIIMEAEGKGMKLPFSRVICCYTECALPSISTIYSYGTIEPILGTATLKYLDDLNVKHDVFLKMTSGDLYHFKSTIDTQIIEQGIPGSFKVFMDRIRKRFSNTIFGIFCRSIRARFRDKTRDRIYTGIRSLGIEATMAERGRVEENIFGPGSLGLIDIAGSPISWINVRKETRGSGESRTTIYFTEYGIHDLRLGPNAHVVNIKTKRVKSIPLVGEVIDLHWKGGDLGLGIIDRLNDEQLLKEPIMRSRDVTIAASGKYGYWSISTETREVPSRALWDCYQAIAGHLLAEWSH